MCQMETAGREETSDWGQEGDHEVSLKKPQGEKNDQECMSKLDGCFMK